MGTVRESVELEVPFHDVDSLDVVWHGHYLKYLEIARTALFRRLGFEPAPGKAAAGRDAEGHSLRIVESQIRHVAPLRYGDRVRVTAWVKQAEPHIVVAYDVYNATQNRPSARARTTVVVVNREGQLVTKLRPESLGRLNE